MKGSSLISASGAIAITTGSQQLGGLPESGAVWLAQPLYLADQFEIRFRVLVGPGNICVTRQYILESDPITHGVIDTTTLLSPPSLLASTDEISSFGTFDPLPVFGIMEPFEGIELTGGCEDSSTRIGGDGFTLIFQNTANKTEAMGCAGTGLGYT